MKALITTRMDHHHCHNRKEGRAPPRVTIARHCVRFLRLPPPTHLLVMQRDQLYMMMVTIIIIIIAIIVIIVIIIVIMILIIIIIIHKTASTHPPTPIDRLD